MLPIPQLRCFLFLPTFYETPRGRTPIEREIFENAAREMLLGLPASSVTICQSSYGFWVRAGDLQEDERVVMLVELSEDNLPNRQALLSHVRDVLLPRFRVSALYGLLE